MLNDSVPIGATFTPAATTFRVWAPDCQRVDLILEGIGTENLERRDGYHLATIANVPHETLYWYMLDGNGPFPDPVSRFQPRGVHGPSMVIDPSRYAWKVPTFAGVRLEDAVVYELHVGTFTHEGTFRAATDKLDYLRDLGITAIELMPVADFPGRWNWGYDGVAPFAPARCYGTPDELRAFIDGAHERGIAVVLDVVYNHFGPDGAYQGLFSKSYFSGRHRNVWGDGINFDGDDCEPVREYFVENARRWIHEYRLDGLRFDAVHAIHDDGDRHILAAIAATIRDSLHGAGRHLLTIAEDSRNLAFIVQPEHDGGWGLDAVWADDFHHQVRRALAGDSESYYRHFDGSVDGIVQTAKQGWFRMSTDPQGLAYPAFVFCIQNHDQIGNRADGDRLHHTISPAAYRAASALLLLLPQTPMLFMGQEWATSSPFCYFTDHHDDLGRLVSEGRRREFGTFASFGGEVPDPQSPTTFESSKLQWPELDQPSHAAMRRLYRDLISLRRRHPSLRDPGRSPQLHIEPAGEEAIVVRRGDLLMAVALQGAPSLSLPEGCGTMVFSSEHPDYALDPRALEYQPGSTALRFHRPGAAVLECRNTQEPL